MLEDARRYARGAVRRILRREEDVEDVLQVACLNAWRHRRRFRKDSRFETWFTRIAINEALMRLRRVKLRRETPVEDFKALEVFCAGPDAEERLIRGARREALAAAVLALPPVCRREMLLRAADIEEPRPFSYSTHKARRHRARTILKEALSK